jgi:hypothetical protein
MEIIKTFYAPPGRITYDDLTGKPAYGITDEAIERRVRFARVGKPQINEAVRAEAEGWRNPVKLTKAGKPAKKQPKRLTNYQITRLSLFASASDMVLTIVTPAYQAMIVGHGRA